MWEKCIFAALDCTRAGAFNELLWRGQVRVADYEPQTWFLLEESGRYYIDARVTRSAAEWSILVQLTPQEYREYHAIGRLYLCYLAARIHNFADEYSARDLNRELGEKVTHAIQEWRASNLPK